MYTKLKVLPYDAYYDAFLPNLPGICYQELPVVKFQLTRINVDLPDLDKEVLSTDQSY